jgi:hypothetical protein
MIDRIRSSAAGLLLLGSLLVPGIASAETLLCRGGIIPAMIGVNVTSQAASTKLEVAFLFYSRYGGTGGKADLQVGECTFSDRGLQPGDYGMIVQSLSGTAAEDIGFFTALGVDNWIAGGRKVTAAMPWLPADKDHTAGTLLDPNAYFEFTVVADPVRQLWVVQTPSAPPCAGAITVSGGQTGNFNTTGPVCFRTAANLAGWGCSNFTGRTVQVNGLPLVCGPNGNGALPLPAKWSDGYTYFSVSAGALPYASMYWW